MELKLEIENKEGVTVIYPDGFINAHTVNQFEETLQNLVKEKHYRIVLNGEGLEYISSAGMGALMGVIEEIRDNDGDIHLCNLSESVFNVFDILGFTELYEIFEEEAPAITAFDGHNRK
ncbi:MAG: STAS domain-containing protein [Acidobacteria bacterium]|nr:STAS domain-containing protein [Acidobacteriota bacterium]